MFLREGLRGEIGEKIGQGEKIKLLGDFPFSFKIFQEGRWKKLEKVISSEKR